MLNWIIFTSVLLVAYAVEPERLIVSISQGQLRGYHKQSYGGRTYSAFEGIPYAKPPVGDLRFKEPQPADAWNGIWEATLTYECIQLTFISHDVVGDEDCLYLNVYVPNEKQSSSEDLLDVVVYIHGGGFMVGSADTAVPLYIMDRNVIYVNINYRLNVLGFLSTEDEVVPGNNGLKDQTLALKWVQENIKSFGGNPNSVTIVGQSAGGASVHYHYISPLSKGLFHRGFAMSGTVINSWALQEKPLVQTKELAKLVGCDHDATSKIINCLKQRSARSLVEKTAFMNKFSEFPIAVFGPVVENVNKEGFLLENPYKLLNGGNIYDVPLITSATSDEGLVFMLALSDKLDELDERWNEVLPYTLDYHHTATSSAKTIVSQKIKEFYIKKEKLSHADVASLTKLFGDRCFLLPFQEATQIQAKLTKSPVYSYLYNYDGDSTFSKKLGLHVNGVTHCDDIMLFLPMGTNAFTRQPIVLEKLSASDEAIKEFFLDILTSFAKNGKPEAEGVIWEPVKTGDQFEYLHIKAPGNIKMEAKKELAPTKFWSSLPLEENKNILVATRDEL